MKNNDSPNPPASAPDSITLDPRRLAGYQKRFLFWRNLTKRVAEQSKEIGLQQNETIEEFNLNLAEYSTLLRSWSTQDGLTKADIERLESLCRNLEELENDVRLIGRLPSY